MENTSIGGIFKMDEIILWGEKDYQLQKDEEVLSSAIALSESERVKIQKSSLDIKSGYQPLVIACLNKSTLQLYYTFP